MSERNINKVSLSMLLEKRSHVISDMEKTHATIQRNDRILSAINRAIDRINNPRGGLTSLEISVYELEKRYLWPHEPPYFRG